MSGAGDLDGEADVLFWTEHLGVSVEEISEAVGKVGCNRKAVEIYLGVTLEPVNAGPSRPVG